LVDSSTHPVSKAIKKYLEQNYNSLNQVELEKVTQIHAKGLEAIYQGKKLLGGNSQLLKDNGIDIAIDTQYTIYNFAIDNQPIISFELEDALKDNSKELIEYFKLVGVEPIMATGDHESVAKRIAQEVGISNYKSTMSPIDKANYIESLKKDGKIVVMVGDGVNDALALSKADVSIAMGSGADVALAISDVVILNNSLLGVKDSFHISRRTYKFIKQNLTISLVYNIVTIPIAIAGFVMPLVAALSMSLSSLLVVGNSMRIKK